MRVLLALLCSLPLLLPSQLLARDHDGIKADQVNLGDPRVERFHQYLKAPEKVLGGRVDVHWTGEGDLFWYTDEADGSSWRVDPATAERVALPSAPALEAETEPRVIREALFPGMPPIREVPSPDGRWAVTEHQHDLWLRSSQDQRLVRLTTGGSELQPWLVVQDDQWNRTRWSPDSLYLAAVREDRRHVPREPVIHWLKTHAEVQFFPMAKAGEPLPTTELWIFDALAQRGLRVDTLPGEAYFHFLGFHQQELLYLRASRDFKTVHIRAANVRTGESRTVLEEHQETFIKNLSINPSWVQLFTLLPQSNQFLWTSERDGWDHLYLYDLQGKLLKRLTRGDFPVLRVVEVDEAKGWCISPPTPI